MMKFNFVRKRIFGIDIRISFGAIALLTLAAETSGNNNLIPLCFLCSAFHEMGHLFCISLFKGKPRCISLSAEGLSIITDVSVLPLLKELLVESAGIIVNFVFALVSYLLYIRFNFEGLMSFSMCNLCLGVFNALPLMSLDGGQMLFCVLKERFDLLTCDRIIGVLSLIFAVPIGIIGLLVLFTTRYNYSLLLVTVYIIVLITNKEMR